MYKRIIHLQSEPSERKYKRVGLFGQKVDLVDHYERKLEDIEQNLRMEQSEASLAEVKLLIALLPVKPLFMSLTLVQMSNECNLCKSH